MLASQPGRTSELPAAAIATAAKEPSSPARRARAARSALPIPACPGPLQGTGSGLAG